MTDTDHAPQHESGEQIAGGLGRAGGRRYQGTRAARNTSRAQLLTASLPAHARTLPSLLNVRDPPRLRMATAAGHIFRPAGGLRS